MDCPVNVMLSVDVCPHTASPMADIMAAQPAPSRSQPHLNFGVISISVPPLSLRCCALVSAVVIGLETSYPVYTKYSIGTCRLCHKQTLFTGRDRRGSPVCGDRTQERTRGHSLEQASR